MARPERTPMGKALAKDLDIDDRYAKIIDGARAKDLGKHKKKKKQN